MSEKEENDNGIRCKTIIVGDSGVGKTSIIQRYLGDFKENESPTVGATFSNKPTKINNKTIIFEIWDTAGQERFRSINSIFYQDASICLLTYDITNKKSFQELKDYWYNSVVEQSSPNIIFHVVGNKNDLFDKGEVDKNEVDEYCEKIGVESSLISAKDENSGSVDLLFQKIGEKYLESDICKENLKKISMTKTTKLKVDTIVESIDEEEKGKKKKCC